MNVGAKGNSKLATPPSRMKIKYILKLQEIRTLLAYLYTTDFFGNVFDFIVHEANVIFDRFGEFAAGGQVLAPSPEKTRHETNISHMIVLPR